MDPLTHVLATRKLISKDRNVVIAGVAADTPFYLTYPTWLILRGQASEAFRKNEWPEAPHWMYTLHHIFHSLPVLLAVTVGIRAMRGYWPLESAAWALHILIDLPTHSRRNWAPQFLWPISQITIDGVSWPDVVIPQINRLFKNSREDNNR